MKKWKKILTAALPVVLLMAVPAYAGQWKQDTAGWWYQQDDGSYLKDGWYWIDGNRDGISECYLFGNDGYLVTDSSETGGYEVNSDGAWVENGIVQIRTEAIDENDPVSVYRRAADLARNLDCAEVYVTETSDVELLGISASMVTTQHLRMEGVGGSGMRMLLETEKKGIGSEESSRTFYVDGKCYLDSGNTRIKLTADPAEIAEVAGNSMHYLSVEALDAMKDLSMGWEGENRVITYDLDPAACGFENTEDTTYEVRELGEVLVIDRSGYCIYQKRTIDASQIIDYGDGLRMTSKVKDVMEMRLENPGQKVEVPIPSTDGYEEIYDLQ